jgi:3'-phosphoadenosine 5'-phosphosulfate sulfotransferase
MEQLLKRFLWWIYMTRNKLLSKWFSIKLNWLEFRYKGAENIPKEKISEIFGSFSKTDTAVLVRNIRIAAIMTDIANIRPMVQHGQFYKDLVVIMTSEDLAERDDASSRIGYLFTTPLESRNATLEEMLACLVRYQELTEADVSYIKENLNYNSAPSTDLKGDN